MILMLITILFFLDLILWFHQYFFNTNFLDLDAKSFQEITWLP